MNNFWSALIGGVLTSAILLGTIKACTPTQEELAEEARQAEQAKAKQVEDAKPRLFSQGNGCEVWKFKPENRWLYFTVCDKNRATSTDNKWEECRQVSSGKSTITKCVPNGTTISNEGK